MNSNAAIPFPPCDDNQGSVCRVPDTAEKSSAHALDKCQSAPEVPALQADRMRSLSIFKHLDHMI
jgi:hypothetical protein